MLFDDMVLARAGADFVGSALVSEDGLRNVVVASYDLAGQVPQGPFSYTADRLTFGGFGFSQVEVLDAEGARTQQEVSVGVDRDDPARIDILWRGAVRAGAEFPLATTGVESIAAFGVDDLDAAIGGTLPTDPAALEDARRTALLARIKSGANDPDAFDDASIEALLDSASATSVTELVELEGGPARFSQLVLSITPIPGTVGGRSRTFPISAAILVRDATQPNLTLATMLQASRAVRERLHHAGFDVVPDPALPRAQVAVMWTVPASWFDDDGWPGSGGSAAARRANRILRAGQWLAGQGIALNPINLN